MDNYFLLLNIVEGVEVDKFFISISQQVTIAVSYLAKTIKEIEEEVEELVPPPPPVQTTNYIERLLNIPDWKELVRLPIFFSSLAISLLYLTVLSYVSSTPLSLSFLIGHIYSFDGIMVGYLKTISYSDNFIAEMRGLCVITGLVGTALSLPLEQKIGSVRAGNWSIW